MKKSHEQKLSFDNVIYWLGKELRETGYNGIMDFEIEFENATAYFDITIYSDELFFEINSGEFYWESTSRELTSNELYYIENQIEL